MSQESNIETDERTTLPIERSFPIERVNEIASKEGRAKMHYRPIYTMHKWWARRLGCVFRAICLYALLDDPSRVEVLDPGEANMNLGEFSDGINIASLLDQVDLEDPESLWEIYPKDVRISDKKILDPFMGGGTSLVEASRFGAESVGYDLNPVAWFVTKKQIEAGQKDIHAIERGFERVKQAVAGEILDYYRTPCPNGDHEADIMYYFWARQLNCTSCETAIPLHKDYRVAKGRFENDDHYHVLCPICGDLELVSDWRSPSCCSSCGETFDPSEGTASGGSVACPDCGQKFDTVDAVQSQGGYEERLYAFEWYCPTCDDRELDRSRLKGYRPAKREHRDDFVAAAREWKESDILRDYVPNESIPDGHKTRECLNHEMNEWKDMFNQRQLLCLSKLLRAIDTEATEPAREYLLLAFTEALNFNNRMVPYQAARNHTTNLFKSNSFDPPQTYSEGNLWGTKYGIGSFRRVFDMILSGIRYAHAPTERHVESGETIKTEPFEQPIGEGSTVHQGDMRGISEEEKYDAVITDPPYYNNIIYSELSDYFYVWQKVLLHNEYEWFQQSNTPHAESIVTNPFHGKTDEDFESELHEAFKIIHRALKEDGVLTFTYHHSDSESWGELLTALCDVGFEITATYPISADEAKFFKGDAVSFDIIIVARPAGDRDPISWRRLRQRIYKTARRTNKRLEQSRDLARGDIGVVEMGRCFHEYSKHHGEVHKGNDVMTAKEVVEEIYGIIQDASQVGAIDVFVDLLETSDPDASEVNKLCRSASTNSEELEDARLQGLEGGEFWLGTWDDERRQAYISSRVHDGDDLTALDKVQFLRYRYEQGRTVSEYVERWDGIDEVRELSDRLADATDDDVYRRVLGDRDVTGYSA